MTQLILRSRYRTNSRLLALACHMLYPCHYFRSVWLVRWWLQTTCLALRPFLIVLLLPVFLPAQQMPAWAQDMREEQRRMEVRLRNLENGNAAALARIDAKLSALPDIQRQVSANADEIDKVKTAQAISEVKLGGLVAAAVLVGNLIFQWLFAIFRRK